MMIDENKRMKLIIKNYKFCLIENLKFFAIFFL